MLREALPKVTGTWPGPKTKAMMERRDACMPDAIKPFYPMVIDRAEGAMIQDPDGNIFVDWSAGVGVMNIGYSQPELIEAVKKQSEILFHSMMNVAAHEGYIKLAEKMNQIVPVRGDKRKTMLVNSGAEAVENAVKIAKSVTGRPNIIVFTGAFHGRTQLTMTMTAKKAFAVGMGPFPDGVYRTDFPYMYRRPKGMSEADAIKFYVEKLENAFLDLTPKQNTAAIVFEPLQGEGGFVPAPLEWVKAVRKICDDAGIMMIADEVQSGFGRCGKMFASEYHAEAGCAPDILVAAKSMGGGLPISAVTTSAEIMDKVTVGVIGGTYGGNAISCASALAVIDVMERDDYPAKARKINEKCMAKFNEWVKKYEIVGDARGIGAMMGIEYVTDKESKTPNPAVVQEIIKEGLQKGLLLQVAGTYGNVIRFLAPLCITDAQLEAGLKIYEEVLDKVTK